jgi:hypothetical protein
MSGDDFDWSHNNEDVVMPEQRSTAVYANQFGSAVIRQEKNWPDEEGDPYLVIDHAHLPDVIAKLQAIASQPRQRDLATRVPRIVDQTAGGK